MAQARCWRGCGLPPEPDRMNFSLKGKTSSSGFRLEPSGQVGSRKRRSWFRSWGRESAKKKCKNARLRSRQRCIARERENQKCESCLPVRRLGVRWRIGSEEVLMRWLGVPEKYLLSILIRWPLGYTCHRSCRACHSPSSCLGFRRFHPWDYSLPFRSRICLRTRDPVPSRISRQLGGGRGRCHPLVCIGAVVRLGLITRPGRCRPLVCYWREKKRVEAWEPSHTVKSRGPSLARFPSSRTWAVSGGLAVRRTARRMVAVASMRIIYGRVGWRGGRRTFLTEPRRNWYKLSLRDA